MRDNTNKIIVRELSLLGREIRNQARLKNMTFRLVLHMEEKENSYWVESAQGEVLAKGKDAREQEEKAAEGGDPEKKEPPLFEKTTKFFKNKRVLPEKLFITSVETESVEEPLTTGNAYIYFTREGLVEKSIIQLSDKESLNWTLIYNPLTGHADIVDKPVKLRDLKIE